MAKLTHEDILAYLEEATILELNDLVSAIEEKFGVVAAAAVAAPAAGAAAFGAAAGAAFGAATGAAAGAPLVCPSSTVTLYTLPLTVIV